MMRYNFCENHFALYHAQMMHLLVHKVVQPFEYNRKGKNIVNKKMI